MPDQSPRDLPPDRLAVGKALRHDSAAKHVSGEALYIDDLREPAGLLHVYLGLSTEAHARIVALDLEPVRSAPGVVAVLTASDVPGHNDISSVGKGDEPLFPDALVQYVGQPIFAVVAERREQARIAARRAIVQYEPLPAIVTLGQAMSGNDVVTPGMTLARGDVVAALAASPNRLKGRLETGGQEHFYLEGQVALAIPGEDGDMQIWSSTQHPSEVQHIVAHVLGCANHAVTVEVRRMGGGFGGKETQSNLFAAAAAIAARATGRPAKLRIDRDDDFLITGKRHDFVIDYEVGFDADGRIGAVEMVFNARCGFSADLSGPITDRALFHADNCYFYDAVRLTSRPLRTHTASNTAFRGFGGPQGMLAAERVIEEIAFALGKDPLEIRRLNCYAPGRDVTPYHQTVEEVIAADLLDALAERANYAGRRRDIAQFNRDSRIFRRGMALTPVKFGISFTATHFNQAGALLHVYTDGSVQLNHGGTEMGQGLHIKVAQIVAEELQIPLNAIRVTATTTGKVPNTSATAASSGSDMNGMAARDAARTIRMRLAELAGQKWGCAPDEVRFAAGRVVAGAEEMSFAQLVKHAYMARVSLSATGFYKTPKIHWDRAKGIGRPFYYFAYGAALSQVTIDTLTGEYTVDRVDILHDVGASLNPAIDLGQIEGGFIQGMGWLTTEELWWDEVGRLRSHAPSTYKIPACSDRPPLMTIELWDRAPNREETIHRSKAVGEPPLMLAISVLHALSDAVASLGDHRICPRLDPPATPERVLSAIEHVRRAAM